MPQGLHNAPVTFNRMVMQFFARFVTSLQATWTTSSYTVALSVTPAPSKTILEMQRCISSDARQPIVRRLEIVRLLRTRCYVSKYGVRADPKFFLSL